jgi:predicted TIM-barrel fold metal-dependent hydrolase
MLIIDSQVHVWPADRPDRPLLRDGQGRENSPYRYEQLLADMDRAGVDCAILVPPSIEGDRNDYALEAAQKYPGRFAVMGRFPVNTGKGRNLLESWHEQAGMLGVRLTFHRDADRPWLTDGTADWFWPEAERHGIPVMVHAPERLAEIGEIAARHPKLAIIVDHMGFARETMDDKAMPAVERMNALARHPNVFVKVSTLPCYSTEPYPFRNLRAPLRRAVLRRAQDRSGGQAAARARQHHRRPRGLSAGGAVGARGRRHRLRGGDLERVLRACQDATGRDRAHQPGDPRGAAGCRAGKALHRAWP